MELERFDTPGLAHYSYVLADAEAGVMAVIDPRRDVGEYLDYARARNLSIAHIFETHIHADYCSGARQLAQAAGAPVHLSKFDEGETYTVTFPHHDLGDGDEIEFGAIRIRALHTPGHTPEHLAFLVYDLGRSAQKPQAMLSGDFLFVGSVGRPDLLGEQQKQSLARQMFRSVREKLAGLPDDLSIYPAHGAGSMCGSGMSGRGESTLGLERAGNPYLDPRLGEQEFIDRLLADVPPLPPYYRRMKKVNAAGPRLLPATPMLKGIAAAGVEELIRAGAVVIDLRDQIAFGETHIPGAFGIGLAKQLPVWAAWVVPYDTPIILVSDNPHDCMHAAVLLSRVGLDEVAGFLQGGMPAWMRAGGPLARLPQMRPRELAAALVSQHAHPAVIDVRSDTEWDFGHIEGAIHQFGGTIEDHLDQLPAPGAPVVVACGGGYRSTVVASVLQRHGFSDVRNLTGGMGAWHHAGLPAVASPESMPALKVGAPTT